MDHEIVINTNIQLRRIAMNVLDFVNSTDIRDYLKKIDYKCNQLEASWLVYQNGMHTLEEKMNAWN